MNGFLSNVFGSNFGSWSFVIFSQLSSDQNTQSSALSPVLSTSSSSCSSQIPNQVFFLLFVVLMRSGRVCFVCSHFLSWLSVLFYHFHFFILLSSSSHEHVNSQLERVFSRIFFIISDAPSLNHRWPGMGAMRSPWPSMGTLRMSWLSVNCTGVSVRAASGPDSTPHRFHHNCEEILLWKLRNLFAKKILINHEFLFFSWLKKMRFFIDALFLV